jgi:hypothetical protein
LPARGLGEKSAGSDLQATAPQIHFSSRPQRALSNKSKI